MNSRIPSLDFIRSHVGFYKTADEVIGLRLEHLGYGASMTLPYGAPLIFRLVRWTKARTRA